MMVMSGDSGQRIADVVNHGKGFKQRGDGCLFLLIGSG
jgi:hypothetical protein